MNGPLITCDPPHELVIVRVPDDGRVGTVIDPVNVKFPPEQEPGTAVIILQFVVPDPSAVAFV